MLRIADRRLRRTCAVEPCAPRDLAVGRCIAASVAERSALLRTPTFWTVATQADFLKGDVEDLSIDSDGRIFLGPSPRCVAETVGAVPVDGGRRRRTARCGPDRQRRQGPEVGRDGKMSTFFDAAELEVHALAPAPNGGLYVGTSPDGKIYQVAADGTSKTFFDPDDKYIWALAVDRHGNVFAATGDKGVIYKITPDGKGRSSTRPTPTNVVSLAFDNAGDLIAGTESPGRVFSSIATGKAFVLLDSPFQEIHARAAWPTDGTIYAAALNGRRAASVRADRSRRRPSPTRAPVPRVSAEITAVGVVDTRPPPRGSAPSTTARPRNGGRGAIYRIRPDGLWDPLWETGDDAPYDLVIEPSGSLLVGTGNEGKIFRVGGDPARATLLARAAARQVTALLREPSGRIVGADQQSGQAVRARADAGASAAPTSPTSATPARWRRWGVIRWRAAATPGAGRDLHAHRQHRDARRDLERVVEGLRQCRRRADRQPERALPAVARGARPAMARGSPVLTSVTPPICRATCGRRSSSITVHPAGHGLPAAVLDRRARDRRLRGQHVRRPAADPVPPPPAAQSAPSAGPGARAAASTRRAADASSGRRTTRTTTGCSSTCSIGAKARRRGRCSSAGCGIRSSSGTRRRCPTAPTSSRSPRPTRRRTRPAPRWSASWRASPSTSTTRRRRSSCSRRRAPARARRCRSSCATTQSAVQRVEYSLDASRWRVVYPKDGIPDSRREEFEVDAGRERAGAERDHPRDRRDEQRRDGGG